jgi:hypothetical protein
MKTGRGNSLENEKIVAETIVEAVVPEQNNH